MDNQKTEIHKKLYQTLYFRLSFEIPIILSLLFFYFINSNNELIYSFKINDLKNLLNSLYIPITLLSLSIPLVAISAAIHRSIETALQIEIQDIQNRLSNHFKHLEEFKKRFQDDKRIIYFGGTEALYRQIYPRSKNGILKPDKKIYMLAEHLDVFLLVSQPIDIDIPSKLRSASLQIVKNLNLESKPYNPVDLFNIFRLINDAVEFSALNEGIRGLDDNFLQRIELCDSFSSNFNFAIRHPNSNFRGFLENHGLIKNDYTMLDDKSDALEWAKDLIPIAVINTLLEAKNCERAEDIVTSLNGNEFRKIIKTCKQHLSRPGMRCHEQVSSVLNFMKCVKKMKGSNPVTSPNY